jgi:hypothetical protein
LEPLTHTNAHKEENHETHEDPRSSRAAATVERERNPPYGPLLQNHLVLFIYQRPTKRRLESIGLLGKRFEELVTIDIKYFPDPGDLFGKIPLLDS